MVAIMCVCVFWEGVCDHSNTLNDMVYGRKRQTLSVSLFAFRLTVNKWNRNKYIYDCTSWKHKTIYIYTHTCTHTFILIYTLLQMQNTHFNILKCHKYTIQTPLTAVVCFALDECKVVAAPKRSICIFCSRLWEQVTEWVLRVCQLNGCLFRPALSRRDGSSGGGLQPLEMTLFFLHLLQQRSLASTRMTRLLF